jgi:hypothetical protein
MSFPRRLFTRGEAGSWGHRVTGGPRRGRSRHAGWDFLYVCIDDASRLAYTEILLSARKDYTMSFLERATAWLGRHGALQQ